MTTLPRIAAALDANPHTGVRGARWYLVAIALWLCLPAHASDLATQAKVFLDAQVLQVPGDVEVTVGDPDARLALADCARAEPFLPPNTRLWGKTHVGIRCVEGATWTAYLPVNVRIFAPAPVAAHSIARGDILTAADFRMDRIELTQWPLGELAQPDQVDGRMATRAIAAAEPVRRGLLKTLPLITPGDTVRVVLAAGNLSITTDGKALTSAGLGEGVQVALATGKTLWGTANPGKVVQIR